jgi:putative flippase GtrA
MKLTRKQNLEQSVKFLLFSCTAGIVQVVSFTILNETTNLPYWPAYLIALVLSVLYNFTINRRFTFKSANNVPIAMLKVACYYAVFTPMSTWWGARLTDIGWNEYVVLIGTMVVNFVTEFLFWRFVVFGKTINTNKLAKKDTPLV